MNPERTANIWKFTALGTVCQLAMVVAGILVIAGKV